MQTRVPCVLMRGGTSRGPFFLASDLPADTATRDAVLLSVMGSPHEIQVDGIGGAHSVTSKVAITPTAAMRSAQSARRRTLCENHRKANFRRALLRASG